MMSKVYKKISVISQLLPKAILTSFLIFCAACSTVQESTVHPLTERERLFNEAESQLSAGNLGKAQELYFRISRNADGEHDSVYDRALWRLVGIYEKNDESEKALLALQDLSQRRYCTLPPTNIKFSQIKNHFRVRNFFQARELVKDVDRLYKSGEISVSEIYDALMSTTDLAYDRHAAEELLFIGAIQKYFVFVMEGGFSPQNSEAAERLMLNYESFYATAKADTRSLRVRKPIASGILEQLKSFERYRLDDRSTEEALDQFSKFSAGLQRRLADMLSK